MLSPCLQNISSLLSTVPKSWHTASHLIFVTTPWVIIVPISQIRKPRLSQTMQFAQVYLLKGGTVMVQTQCVWFQTHVLCPYSFRFRIKEKRMKSMKLVAWLWILRCLFVYSRHALGIKSQPSDSGAWSWFVAFQWLLHSLPHPFQPKTTWLNYFTVWSFSYHHGSKGGTFRLMCWNSRWATTVVHEAPILKKLHMEEFRKHWAINLSRSQTVLMILQNTQKFQVDFTCSPVDYLLPLLGSRWFWLHNISYNCGSLLVSLFV